MPITFYRRILDLLAVSVQLRFYSTLVLKMAGVNNQGPPVHHGNRQNTPPPEQNFYMAVTKHMDDVNKLLHYHGEMFGLLKGQVSSVHNDQQSLAAKLSQLERRYDQLCSYTRYLEDYCLELDVNSRKSHVILTGVNENADESSNENMNPHVTHDIALEALTTICDTVTSDDLEATYRIGKPGRKPRPILIKFRRESVRNEVMKKKKLLKETDETKSMFMNEDLPPVINKRRAEMRAVVDNARNRNVPASMMGNRMSVNNISYEYKDIHSLPPGLKLADAKIQAVKGGIAFQSEHAYLSNFFPCQIKFGDHIFGSSEQLYQYERALFANDSISVNDILRANTAQKAKRAAVRVSNSPSWDQVKLDKMKHIIDLKFNQNPVLKAEILKTGEAHLIEATIDTFWGAGLPLTSRKLRDGNWRGHNHLGKILMNYRYEVRRSMPPPQMQNTMASNYCLNAPPSSQQVIPNQPSTTDMGHSNQPTMTPSNAPPSAQQLIPNQPPTMDMGYSSQPTVTSSNTAGLGQISGQTNSFALPLSQVYSTQYVPSGSQNSQSFQSSQAQVQASPTAFSTYSDGYSTQGDRRLDYDPNMSPHFMS